MILPDKVYKALKWILIAFVPALILFIETLGSIYGFETSIIVRTISAIATFVATLMGISNYNYYKQDSDKKK